MAQVNIHTGQLPSAAGVSDDRLRFVVNDWCTLCAITFPEDCRGLLRIVEETEKYDVWRRMGFSSPAEFYKQNLCLEPEHVEIVVTWLKENPNEKAAFGDAVRAGALAKQGRPRKGEENKGNNITFNRGTAPTYTVRRLMRDNPELAQRVIDGELSANAAAIQAGFRRKKIQIEPTVDGFRRAISKHLSASDAGLFGIGK